MNRDTDGCVTTHMHTHTRKHTHISRRSLSLQQVCRGETLRIHQHTHTHRHRHIDRDLSEKPFLAANSSGCDTYLELITSAIALSHCDSSSALPVCQTYTHINTHTHIHTHIHTHTHAHTRTRTPSHTQIHTRTHAHTHTQRRKWKWRRCSFQDGVR